MQVGKQPNVCGYKNDRLSTLLIIHRFLTIWVVLKLNKLNFGNKHQNMFSVFDSFRLINTRTTQTTSKFAIALSLLVTLLIFLLFTLKMIELASHANVTVNG